MNFIRFTSSHYKVWVKMEFFKGDTKYNKESIEGDRKNK